MTDARGVEAMTWEIVRRLPRHDREHMAAVVEEWMELRRVDGRLRAWLLRPVGEQLRHLEGELGARAAEIRELRAEVSRLGAELRSQARLVGSHEDLVRDLLAERARARADLAGEEHRSLDSLADDFRRIYQNGVRRLALESKRLLGEPAPDDWEPRWIAMAMSDLFAGPEPDGERLRALAAESGLGAGDPRLDRLIDDARRLRSDTGRPHGEVWIFAADAGEGFDLWGRCEETAPVEVIVRPAMVFDGEVFVRPLVYTGRPAPGSSPDGAEPAAAGPGADGPRVPPATGTAPGDTPDGTPADAEDADGTGREPSAPPPASPAPTPPPDPAPSAGAL
jgi:hypothetical protein